MNTFRLSLFDLLKSDPDNRSELRSDCSLEAFKSSVAKDIESLLNCRAYESVGVLAGGWINKTILNFGLVDFSSKNLASSEDMRFVCRAIERAIAYHEPRLQAVSVDISSQEAPARDARRIKFIISAKLVLDPFSEAVKFDLVLDPVSSSYVVGSPSARG